MDNSDSYYNSLNKEQCIHMLNQLKHSIYSKENDLEKTDNWLEERKDNLYHLIDMRMSNFEKAYNIIVQIKKADLIENIMLLKTEYSKTESRLKYLLNE
ncbi:hypothetical protein Phi46:3_gp097 [Cellulophaga phage phi46:3]|uniref:Uncharacterized protein n=1 Tax=Cellulophaga phage phi46:3 TaxID=1327985 RepID=S0A0E0_9CAUD|nr:hypothetical protein Phi46:3_gp097 [Cellulophaga phage phi46:3]AGO48841.1 hypothetical protein Phi46:3_gp097 [Cellulophaga phage phi46:3]